MSIADSLLRFLPAGDQERVRREEENSGERRQTVSYVDPAEEDYRQWQKSPEGIVTGYLMDMDRHQLREIRLTVDRELDKREDDERNEAAIKLDRLTRTLAEHKGCPVNAVHFSEHELADARAAVERGEINHVSEYIPF